MVLKNYKTPVKKEEVLKLTEIHKQDNRKTSNLIIKIQELNKWYQIGSIKFHALKNINLEIKEGEFVSILGASGSGKTTLMNVIGCLDKYDLGSYLLDNQEVKNLNDNQLAYWRGQKIGFIFQSFNLLNKYTVLENVILPSLYVPIKDVEQKAKKLLQDVELDTKMSNHPLELSGGQKQRVAIARALIADPKIILADEPTGNLDTNSGDKVMNILKNLNKQGKTVILITHNLDLAKNTDKIINIKDGKII